MANTFETEDYDKKPWWVDYDGDTEEERRKISELVKKIEDPEERLDKYEELLDKLEYNEYYAYNPHLKSESYLINLRMRLDTLKNLDFSSFIWEILSYSNMIEANSDDEAQNILIVNVNKKFTFLNSIDYNNLIERGLAKLRREYGNEWGESDELIYKKVVVRCR